MLLDIEVKKKRSGTINLHQIILLQVWAESAVNPTFCERMNASIKLDDAHFKCQGGCEWGCAWNLYLYVKLDKALWWLSVC